MILELVDLNLQLADTRGYELVARRFNLLSCEFELVTRQVKIVDLNLHF